MDRLLTLAPELAKAIVAAQRSVETLIRDGSGDKGAYTSSDAIAAQASKALNEHGAAWVRLDVDLVQPGLDSADVTQHADIGNQAYVGDVIQRWMIVHEGGAAVTGSSRMPVITSRGRPHDKATAASLTYDVGGALRGALCLDREDKQTAIDRRNDPDVDRGQQKPQPRPSPATKRETMKPESADEIKVLVREIANAEGREPGEVWNKLIRDAGVDYEPRPEALSPQAGSKVWSKASAWARELGVG